MARPLPQNARPLRVMYIDGVGAFGGASRSLSELVGAFRGGAVDAFFLVQAGTVVPIYGALACDLIATRGLTRFDNTRYSHYRGIRWMVLGRELAYLPFTFVSLLRARVAWRHVDLIHANEITELFPLLLARLLFRAPTVVHVRSLARDVPSSWRVRLIHWMLKRFVNAVVAIDENVRATLPSDLAVDVVHNAFTPDRARGDGTGPLLMKLRAIRQGALKLGFVGNLHHSKGLIDLLDAAKLVIDSGRDIELVIAGGATRRDSGLFGKVVRFLSLAQNVADEIPAELRARGLEGRVHLLGATPDIQRVYESVDILCFPSHFDAPGRPVFEAAFSGVPAIVAVREPRPDTLIDGETGIAVPIRSPVKLAEAISHFVDNRPEVHRMGMNARCLAEANFSPSKNAEQLLAIYYRLTGDGPVA